jgi:hypothetical protein
MKRLKTLTMTAVALVFLLSAPAAAQTVPTLAAIVGPPNGFGAVVTLQWSALPLAQGYTLEAGVEPGVALLSYSVPASVTQVALFAPNGTYYVRIRGFAGSIVGEFSAVQTVVVGGPVTCPPLVAPTIAAENSSYLSVKVDWTPVAGATGYMVEYSRYNGVTELAEAAGPTVNSVSKYAGTTGHFFVRVVAHNACNEQAASGYIPFEITSGAGTGPRTPDPAPGTIIPRANLHYLRAVVEQVAAQYPGDFFNSCATHTYLYRVVHRLRQIDSRWGLNDKRGWPGAFGSHDVVSYNPTDRPDNGEPQVYLYDIIANHCPFSGNPAPNWADVTEATWFGGGRSICAPQGRPDYGGTWCARWTLDPYIRAGFPPDPRQ